MIIKLSKVIHCSSEHPSYPASNLLEYHSDKTWRCAKPGEMLTTVIFQMAEPSTITGLDIGNYRSCVVIVDASTSTEPDKWVPIVNHQFLTNDEAANNKFRDQVQIFTKKELNPATLSVKFDRIKVTCMQSSNPRELFGLTFITFKTEVMVDLGLDVFGRFKMKEEASTSVDSFKEKYLKMMESKPSNYKEELKNKVKESASEKFAKRQEEDRPPPKRPLLQKLEEGKADEVFDKGSTSKTDLNSSSSSKKPNSNVKFTPFGDVVPKKESASNGVSSPSTPKNNAVPKKHSLDVDNGVSSPSTSKNNAVPKKHSLDVDDEKVVKKLRCSDCEECEDKLCKNCGQLYPEKKGKMREEKKNATESRKQKKEFSKLFEGISFSLSGYVNPQRDAIRKKALKMGAKYIADPNTTNNKCTHLVCAFKNTPKYQQLKNCSKIVSHTFIEECFDKKMRFPWRRFALDKSDKNQPESEEEIEASSADPYEMDTEDSDY